MVYYIFKKHMTSDEILTKILEIYEPINNFLHSMTLQIIIKAIIVYILVLWIALIIWVTKDIVSRTNNIIIQVAFIIMTTLLGFFGLIIYFILRPSKTLIQKYNEDLERKMFIETFSEMYNCIKCDAKIEKDFNFCPYCATECRSVCITCGQKIMSHWKTCPYCKSSVGKDNNVKNIQISLVGSNKQ